MAAYAVIALTTTCTSFTHLLLTKRVTFTQVLTLAPWRWFPCRPKHVGALLSILECFNNSTFFNVVCVSLIIWSVQHYLMHGVTMKIIWVIQIKKNEMGRACSMYGEMGGVYRILVGRPERRRPLGRPGRWWNINVHIQEVVRGVDWIDWLGKGTGGGLL